MSEISIEELAAYVVAKITQKQIYYPNWCICNGAECKPSVAVTSYAKTVAEPPFCLHCGKWIRPGWRQQANHMGLGRSIYIPSMDGHG